MESFKTACQTITWGEGQNKKFPEIFAAVAEAGFGGVEIGWRHIEGIAPEYLNRLLQEAGLTLVATHIGGNLADTGQAKSEWTVLDRVLDYLQTTKTSLLMFSGLTYQEKEQFERDLKILLEAADYCSAKGIQLLYHNHNWEFERNGLIFNRLLNSAISFCPDIGWIYKGLEGADVIPVLEKIKNRIGAVHFKDMADSSKNLNPVILGTGKAPLTEAAEWLKRNISKPLWVIAEQDTSNLPPAETAKANGRFLRGLFG